MIINKILGNVSELSEEELKRMDCFEKVYLTNEQQMKRIQRVVTDHGREVGIHIPDYIEFKQGDILYHDKNTLIVIDVLPQDVIVISPSTIEQMGVAAHELGNRHLPAQFENGQMIIQFDLAAKQLLDHLGIHYEICEKRMVQPFRHAGHSHG